MSSPIENDPAVLFMTISTALNALGDSTAQPDPRIAPAVKTLSKINGEYLTNRVKAQEDARTLAAQLSALRATHSTNSSLSDAMDAAQQLAGIWSGDDYV